MVLEERLLLPVHQALPHRDPRDGYLRNLNMIQNNNDYRIEFEGRVAVKLIANKTNQPEITGHEQ